MVHRIRRGPGAPAFPDWIGEPDEDGLIALGGDLSVETLLEAYTKGIFPWSGESPISWYSPDPRLVLLPGDFHTSRSLAKIVRRGVYEVRFDNDFKAIITGCATTRWSTWITNNMIDAYTELHRLGIAHSVETYAEGQLVGGLYGLSLGRSFFGESMFALAPDASKIALRALCARLVEWEFHFVDCQQVTHHLLSLGAMSLSRAEYARRLASSLEFPSRHERWRSF